MKEDITIRDWKHLWLHAGDPYDAFAVWLEARWPHPAEGHWLELAIEMYRLDPEVPREMCPVRPPMPDDPF